MSSAPIGKHAGPGPAGNQASSGKTQAVAEPTYAERARTLMYMGRIGSLSTLSRKQHGFPFGSVMPYGLDDGGRPIFLISTMAMHTQNMQADARASLLVTQPDASGDALGAARITLMGNVALVPEAEIAGARKLYLASYPNSRHWVDFEDFAFYRMDVVDVYYVGGFGVMGWVTAEEYGRAQHDPLADAAARIMQHVNSHHAEALVLLARKFAGVESEDAEMTAVDRLGFHLRLTTSEGVRGARIAFLREAPSTEEVKSMFAEMVEQARQG